MKPPFYITTAIAYTTCKPHVGNALDPVLADAIARYKRARGYDVFFLTGSDEHGQKIEQYAREEGMEPQAYVDKMSAQIRAVWDSMGTSYDRFIRTTDPDHEKAVARIFEKLYEQGDIYKGAYTGKYCVPCESFFTPSQVVDGCCPDCGRPVTDAQEEAYFLRLSKYADRLLAYYEEHPDFLQPASRRAEMINNFLKPGLEDLCVSRSSFTWGVPVTFDPGHVIYVWIDALSNYITGLGYHPDGSGEQYARFWPADLHVIGKDIMRFHSIYWPIILMALGEPLPKQILGHPWVLFGADKMSKSKGNVLYADDLAARFGVDAVRYYLLATVPFAQDGSITVDSLIGVYNTDLANTLGNLANRTIAMARKYFDGAVARPVGAADPLDEQLRAAAEDMLDTYAAAMDGYRLADALEVVMGFARRCNKYIDETMPWALAKDEAARPRLQAVLYHLLESVRWLAVVLTPCLPGTADKLLAQLGVSGELAMLASLGLRDVEAQAPAAAGFGAVEAYTVGEPQPLFARIDAAAALKEWEADHPSKKEESASADKTAAEAVPLPSATLPATITIDEFARVALRAATVTACEPVKKAKKLLKLTLDDGTGTPRVVCSGIAAWYTPAELVGRTVVVVANLKPATLCGVESNGMILAADDGDRARVIFLDGVAPGSVVR